MVYTKVDICLNWIVNDYNNPKAWATTIMTAINTVEATQNIASEAKMLFDDKESCTNK